MRVTLSAVKRIMYRETRPETAPAMATCCFEAFSRGRGNRDAQLDSSRFLSHPLFLLCVHILCLVYLLYVCQVHLTLLSATRAHLFLFPNVMSSRSHRCVDEIWGEDWKAPLPELAPGLATEVRMSCGRCLDFLVVHRCFFFSL